MEIDKNSGLWLIACSYADQEAKDRGLRSGYMPKYRYVRDRAPEIYMGLMNKTYKYVKVEKD